MVAKNSVWCFGAEVPREIQLEPTRMTDSAPESIPLSRRNDVHVTPDYLDLRSLAMYSSCSIRWLRNRLIDRLHPLPHYRIEGKILVKRDDFDQWMSSFRVLSQADGVSEIVESVLAQIRPSKRVT